MENDSFENQLRNKILQAELGLNQGSNKEKVWNAIQKKNQSKRNLYYTAAAILLIMGMVGALNFNNDQSKNPLVNAKQKEKPATISLQKPQILQEKVFERESESTIKTVNDEQFGVVDQLKETKLTLENSIPKEDISAHLSLKSDEIVSKNENIAAVAIPQIVPEFTVQLKKGAPIASNSDENTIITTLKKFKLKRDTTYFASAEEKQSTKIKLTFKKEN